MARCCPLRPVVTSSMSTSQAPIPGFPSLTTNYESSTQVQIRRQLHIMLISHLYKEVSRTEREQWKKRSHSVAVQVGVLRVSRVRLLVH